MAERTPASGRLDVDDQTADFYKRTRGAEPPMLAVGDRVSVAGVPGDLRVDGFRSGGMLVDCTRMADGQAFCLPRFNATSGWVRAVPASGEQEADRG